MDGAFEQNGTAVLSAEEIAKEIKPLSTNAFAAFFQKIWRKWLSVWYRFSDKRPRFSKLLYRLAFFFVFSMGVTIFQYLVTLILPMAFGLTLAGKEFLWPKIYMYSAGGQDWYFNLLGYAVDYKVVDKVVTSEVVIGGGLGYFIAFEIATFLAQVINFPLQRNITFKSHGNPYIQALWYFIGWVLTSLFCNGINSLWMPIAKGAVGFVLPAAVTNIITMFVMGGISMVIFFFIFLIIFPDYNAVEKRTRAKLAKLKARNAPAAKIAKIEAELEDASRKAKLANAEKTAAQAAAQASAKAMSYFASVEADKRARAKIAEMSGADESDNAEKLAKLRTDSEKYAGSIDKHRQAASAAIALKKIAEADFTSLKSQAAAS